MAGKGLKLTKPRVGDTYTLGNASFTIIAPNGDYGNDLNNWSVGIRLDYGDNRFVRRMQSYRFESEMPNLCSGGRR